MENKLEKNFINSKIEKIDFSDDFINTKEGMTYLFFNNQANLFFTYWRLTGPNFKLSIFDHNQKYGMETCIDVRDDFVKNVLNQKVLAFEININKDIKIKFENNYELEIFNFTADEDWNINLSNGVQEFSNH